jgi:hypothetical protein
MITILLAVLLVLTIAVWRAQRARWQNELDNAESELQVCVSLWEGCRERLARACEPCLWPRFNTQHIGEMEWCEGVTTAGMLPCPEPVEKQP